MKNKTMRKKMAQNKNLPTRDGFGKGLVELGKKNKNIVVLSADLTGSTRAGWFQKEFPERLFNMGVAEQDMISSAAGLALSGKIAFACTFGVFASGRAWDQIRVGAAYMNLNIKIAGTHGGISVGPDGATHQAIEEVALMRILPNMKVIVPCDATEAKKATIAAAAIPGPVYLRLGRSGTPDVSKEKEPFKIGKASILKQGKDVSIFACGHMVYEALLAREELAKQGISAAVINLHTIKPIDASAIIRQAKKTGAIVSVEEHSVAAGMGSAIAEVLIQKYPVIMKMVGVKDSFGESGDPKMLYKKFGLTARDVVKAAKQAIKEKR
jgi:transketolase